MNILYINHYAGSIYHGMEYRPYYLAREWVKLGHNVTIIASSISHLRNKNITIPLGQNYYEELIDGINYIWCRTPPYEGNGIKRVINIFTFLYRVKRLIPNFMPTNNTVSHRWLQKFLPQRNYTNKLGISLKITPDLIIASSTYPFDTKVAAKIARRTRAKLVYEVHDLWPLTPIELNGMSRLHPFIWFMQKAEDFGYRNADKVVSLLPKAKTYMCNHGMHKSKFVYIPNGVSISDWQNCQEVIPPEHLNQIIQLKQQYNFLIGYAGSMGEANALNYLLSSAAQLPHYAFVLVGDGALKTALTTQLAQEKITNVFFLPPISKRQIPNFLQQMDALYIGWNKLAIYRFGICPNKLFDYMLAAKPIIHSVTAGNDLVQEAQCGISVPAEDVGAIVKAIDELAHKSVDQRNNLGQNGYNYVTKCHDYTILAKNFLHECGVKVCHITSAHARNDIRIFVKECVTLSNAGYDVSLVVADDLPDEVKHGVKIYSVGKPLSRKQRMTNIPQKIYYKILDLKPDIVHFHDPELMIISTKLAKQKFKVIYDVHEDLPKQIMNKHWLPKRVRPIVSFFIAQLEKFCAKRFYGVIAATPLIEKRLKLYNKNTIAVCNYPLLSELRSTNIDWKNRANKLCYIGSISQTRGIVPLIKSLAISKLPLELAGQLSGGISLNELQQLSGYEYVNYLGIIERNQIAQLLQQVKIGVVTLLPTPSYIESLPIKMFEYMIAGIAVIASNFPLWEDIISKYKCGVLVDPHNSEAIALACQNLLNDEEQAMIMGQNGQQAVQEHFNWEKESAKLLEFYN
ncbi:MAG: glycosyltransferase family 4 protein [Burkholderiales bacterium]|nr:glycosyltransferase family 4 protein [Burkholderiales bacterium]